MLADTCLQSVPSQPKRNTMTSDSGFVGAVSSSLTHSMAKPNRRPTGLLAGLGVEGDAH